MKIGAVIPAFNEEASIAIVVHAMVEISKASGMEVIPIVVNDCSTDKTAEIIKTLPCVALNLSVNLGIGGAVQTGFKYAVQNNFDFVVQIDGDGQHPAKYIPDLVSASLEKKLDVVIGSRFLNKEGFQSSLWRRMGITYFEWLNKILTGNVIKDTTSGMRLVNREALQILSENYPDEYPEPEALIIYYKNNLTCGEVPVEMLERLGGTSSIKSFDALYYMFKVTLAVIFTFIKNK